MNVSQVTQNLFKAPEKDPGIWKAAQALEANFLAEMLKSTGLEADKSGFGGGAGEEHFSSFLTAEYANEAVSAGGIGLAETIYRSLTLKENKND